MPDRLRTVKPSGEVLGAAGMRYGNDRVPRGGFAFRDYKLPGACL
jgi:hypothetical protein